MHTDGGYQCSCPLGQIVSSTSGSWLGGICARCKHPIEVHNDYTDPMPNPPLNALMAPLNKRLSKWLLSSTELRTQLLTAHRYFSVD